MVFEGSFQNTNDGYMVNHISDDSDHHLWLQGPLNHLGSEQRASYIGAILCENLDFLHV